MKETMQIVVLIAVYIFGVFVTENVFVDSCKSDNEATFVFFNKTVICGVVER